MCEFLFFILLISVAGFLIYLANKDGKSESVEICSEKPENTLGKKLNKFLKELSFSDMYTFENFEVVQRFDGVNFHNSFEITDTSDGSKGILSLHGDIYISNLYLDKIIERHYPSEPEKDRLVSFIEDLVSKGVITKSWDKLLSEKLDRDRGRFGLRYGCWVEIGNGKYFTDVDYGVHRFSDWKFLGGKEALKAIEGLPIKACEDPKKAHWKHFLELEMKAKKQREIDCKAFVESILNKQKEYNDLQFKYEMLPSAPITDFESFTNFCKTVHTDVNFEDYEISNMLLLIKSNLNS